MLFTCLSFVELNNYKDDDDDEMDNLYGAVSQKYLKGALQQK